MTDPNENVRQVGQSYSFSTGQEFAEEEQKEKKNRVEKFSGSRTSCMMIPAADTT